jgi:hypothetical protein
VQSKKAQQQRGASKGRARGVEAAARRDGTGVVAQTTAGAQGHAIQTEFLGREQCGIRRTGWGRRAGDGCGGTDVGRATGAGDTDTVIGEGGAWCGKVRQSSAGGKPTAGLVGVADKKADVAQPLDPRAKVGAGVE